MVCTGFKIRPEYRDLTGVRPSIPQPGWLTRVPPVLHDHFVHAVGSQTGEVAERVAAVLHLNGPPEEAYLASLRADGFALSDEDAPTPCDAPVCFLTGQRDRVIGFASLARALSSYDVATYSCLASAGNYLSLEEPALFAALTRSWLAQCQMLLDAEND